MTFHNRDITGGGKVMLLTGPFGDPERLIALDRPMAIAEVIARHDLAFRLPTIAVMDGEPVMRGEWTIRMVRPQDTLAFVAVPRGGGNGGGKQIVGIIAAIALSIAAPIVGQFIAGSILGLTGTALTIGTSIASLAFIAGGSYLLNALMPPANTDTTAAAADSVYTAQAASNTADPLGIIPIPYGRMRFPPRYASAPYAEYSGNDQWLYQLFCLSPGLWKAEKIEIGDTEAWNSTDGYSSTFSDLTFEFVEPGDSITLFPANVEASSDVSGQTVPDSPSVLGPFVVNASGTTINRIAVDFAFPGGLFSVDSGGMGVASNSIPLRAQYQKIDNSGAPIGGWSDIFRQTISFATRTPQRLTMAADVAPARYQVKFFAEAAFDASDATSVNACVWAGLRGYLTGFVTPPNCTMLAMRIKANEQISNASASQINVTGTRWLPVWNGTSWSSPQATTSIAWAAADLLRNTDYGLGLADVQYDLAALLALDATWTGRSDSFNAIFDTAQTAQNALVALLKAGRTQPVRLAGRISFVRLEAKSLKRAVFSPRNVIRGSFQHKLVLFDDDNPDSVNGSYLDATVWDTRQVLATIDTIGGDDPQTVDYFGITGHDQCWREAVTAAAINAYQREFISFTAEWEGKLLVRGDPILVMHPFIEGVATASVAGRVGAVLTVDRDLDALSGDGYVILRDVLGEEWGPCLIASMTGRVITLDAGDLAIVEGSMGTLDDLLPGDREEPAHLLLCDGETRPFNGLLVTATPDSSGQVSILAVVDAPEVYAADGTNTMPSPWATPTLPPASAPLPVIYELTGTLTAAVGGLELNAMWLPAAGATSYVAQASYDGGNSWTPVYSGAENRLTAPINPQPPTLRVAGINGAFQGPWTTVTFVTADLPPGGGYIGAPSLLPNMIDISKFVLDVKNLLGPVFAAVQAKEASLDVDLGEIAENVADLTATVQKMQSAMAVVSNAQGAQIVETRLVSIANGESIASITTQLLAVQDGLAAEIDDREMAVTTVSSALASLETDIAATFGVIGAAGAYKFVVTADSMSATATWTVAVKATDGTFAATSALQVLAKVVGGVATSEIDLMASNINFVDTSGTQVAVPFFTASVGGVSYVGIQNLRIDNITSLDGSGIIIDGTTSNGFGEPYVQVG